MVKKINILITLSFVILFAFLAIKYDYLYAEKKFEKLEIKISEPYTVPPPDNEDIPAKPRHRTESRRELPTDIYKEAPIPPSKPQTSLFIDYSEYIKMAGGAAVGWAVKEICEWMLSLFKILFRNGRLIFRRVKN